MRIDLKHPSDANYEATLAAPSSMEFESKEHAFEFYKNYAVSVGFSAIIKASRRSRISGKFIDAKFVCSMYGSKRGTCPSENSEHTDVAVAKKKRGRINRSWSKTDCKACMHVKIRQDGRWVISSFIGEHNHDLLCQNNLDAPNAIRVRRKQMQNQITGLSSSGLRLRFREGDAQVMLECFSCMQDENPYFFSAMDLNREQRLKNVFWVDAKSRVDYTSFGDAVLFDTMYMKNEFKLPFVPFIGMNNHFQPLLLGCAFVSEESKSSYVWLIRAWVKSMHGQAPRVILTDQDSVLKEAIAEVLPGSRHCFCLSHILGKMEEKLGYVIRQHENFVNKFYKCILKSQTETQFEKRWWKLVDRFDLGTDKWIQSLYDDRMRWVPTFMKDVFLAGLSSTQRLESVTSLLDKSLLRKTSVKEFLHQYNITLQEKYEDEAKQDFDSWHRQPGLKSPSPYGKQMSTIYTHAVFKKFQVEVLGVVACHPKLEGKDGATTTFKVQDFEENQAYNVTWNEKRSDSSCTCFLFEYNGFLCRHVMIVLQISGVNNIPAKYILKRWTKDAKNGDSMKKVDSTGSKNQRYTDLCQLSCKVGDEGSLCQETFIIASTALEEAIRKCESINSSLQPLLGALSPSNDVLREFEEVTRARVTSKTKKEGIRKEKEATNAVMHCWDQMGYLNVRPSTLDFSHGSQENGQQLNSTAPCSDVHPSCLERVYQMGQLQFRSQNVQSSLLIQPNMQIQAGAHSLCRRTGFKGGVETKISEVDNTEAMAGTSAREMPEEKNKNRDPGKENHVKLNQIDVDGDGNVQATTSIDKGNVRRPSLMERNKSARTFEWTEYEPEEEQASRLPSPRTTKNAPLNKPEKEIGKNRRIRRLWTSAEEKALETAVENLGVEKPGSIHWRAIATEYSDSIQDRTDEDLRYKWRNMMKAKVKRYGVQY